MCKVDMRILQVQGVESGDLEHLESLALLYVYMCKVENVDIRRMRERFLIYVYISVRRWNHIHTSKVGISGDLEHLESLLVRGVRRVQLRQYVHISDIRVYKVDVRKHKCKVVDIHIYDCKALVYVNMSVRFRVSGDLEHLESLLVRGVRRVQLLLEGDELAGVEVEARCERCPARRLLGVFALYSY